MFSTIIENFIRKGKYPQFVPKAIFFDMDGVLFDSMKYHASAWVKALHESGLPFTIEEAYMNEGRTGASTIDSVFKQIYGRISTEDEKKTIYSLKSKHFEAEALIEQIPFVFELLKRIQEQQLEIYLVTGSGQASLLDNLEIHFPGVFSQEKMVTAYDVKLGKPHPEPYLIALKKSKLNPWEVVVIENAPLGVESANAAGLFTVAVNTGPLNPKVLTESGANIVFDSMKSLFEHWDEIVNIDNVETIN
jgi:HAD superfamily hydrolase (TIGR01509 family)